MQINSKLLPKKPITQSWMKDFICHFRPWKGANIFHMSQCGHNHIAISYGFPSQTAACGSGIFLKLRLLTLCMCQFDLLHSHFLLLYSAAFYMTERTSFTKFLNFFHVTFLFGFALLFFSWIFLWTSKMQFWQPCRKSRDQSLENCHWKSEENMSSKVFYFFSQKCSFVHVSQISTTQPKVFLLQVRKCCTQFRKLS